MIEIEGFEDILSQITLAKELHEIGRADIIKRYFSDELSWESYYENILGIQTSLFSDYHSSYDEREAVEEMVFVDEYISDYFVYAWEHGKLHNLPYDQNPHLTQAQIEVERWFKSSACVGWKLLGYTKTKKNARQSKLVVQHYTGCSCNALEIITYGLIQLYAWFKEKCAGFELLHTTSEKPIENLPVAQIKIESLEVMAA